jgi:hypothetical protein
MGLLRIAWRKNVKVFGKNPLFLLWGAGETFFQPPTRLMRITWKQNVYKF